MIKQRDARKAKATADSAVRNKTKKGVCFGFRSNGSCTFGDGCKFSHDPSSKAAMNMMRRTSRPRATLERGTLVRLGADCAVEKLRGVEGQVLGTTVDGRVRVELNAPCINWDTHEGQMITMVRELGLRPDELDYPPTTPVASARAYHTEAATMPESTNVVPATRGPRWCPNRN